MNAEQLRLEETRKNLQPWYRWGPYVTERQWGTVREDYSPYGTAWDFCTHDMARSKAFRWGEEGIAGICDDHQIFCFAIALWNEQDPILKERLFGLGGPEGNHGEDVKELYYYLDSTPTHSYMKMLYKYPQVEFPYAHLVEENKRRTKADPEFELIDTGVFQDNRYFDVFVEYAKAHPEDLLIRVTVHNRSAESATLHVLPHLWFRNTWSWGDDPVRPCIRVKPDRTLSAEHATRGTMELSWEGDAVPLFCDNDTNAVRLYHAPAQEGFYKDGIGEYIVHGKADAIRRDGGGTKAALHFIATIDAGASREFRYRLRRPSHTPPFEGFETTFDQRRAEAHAFYNDIQKNITNDDARLVQRQAFAGMLWSKQFYHIDMPRWLNGDPGQPAPPSERKKGRNHSWFHLNNADVISMPDKWEYPWYAAWDLAFHCIPLAMIDPEFAKNQLLLLTHEWYMHPNGQLPAYEWAFGDVNPPVHAWSAWRVYNTEKRKTGTGDLKFLEQVFHKMLLNFTWWVNRKDNNDNNIFQGGFLGLDNIGVFDRSAELPTGGYLEQADGTSWMAMYSLNMMRIALELAKTNDTYEALATKFFEHFLLIAGATNNIGAEGVSLWDDEDSFFYDVLHAPHSPATQLKVRSMVGLIPLFAVEIIDTETLSQAPRFAKRLDWFLRYRPDLAKLVSYWHEPGQGEKRLLSLLRGHRMKCVLRRMLDTSEFLSDYGVRAVSRYHKDQPYVFRSDGKAFTVSYQPGESETELFGGNSNWRGPIWFPVNYLIITALYKFHAYYGDDFKIEYPTGSGKAHTIAQVADELTRRLTAIFLRGSDGRRAVFGDNENIQNDPHFRDHLLFYEYFHGDSGRGVGASHQTGWTGLIAKLLDPKGD